MVMNELIRKFERQSHLDVYSLGKDRTKWESVVNEFAELIVRECVEIAETAEPYQSCDIILRHFGVK